MVELALKYPAKLSGSRATIKQALEEAKIDEKALLAANGTWHTIAENGKEFTKTSEFEFLYLLGNKPNQANLSFEGGKWTLEKIDLTNELGEMGEEGKLLANLEGKLVSEEKILAIVEKELSDVRKSAPHIRIKLISFSVSDEKYEIPAWRVEVGNWPLMSYYKGREKERQCILIIDALSGKVVDSRK